MQIDSDLINKAIAGGIYLLSVAGSVFGARKYTQHQERSNGNGIVDSVHQPERRTVVTERDCQSFRENINIKIEHMTNCQDEIKETLHTQAKNTREDFQIVFQRLDTIADRLPPKK